VKLDITNPADAESAVRSPRLERPLTGLAAIDVLVNNAANFYAAFFEELSPQ
jgi:NAD(P)-dependent dehydrogenase (short-subunit alcohol dehydrogenase family)